MHTHTCKHLQTCITYMHTHMPTYTHIHKDRTGGDRTGQVGIRGHPAALSPLFWVKLDTSTFTFAPSCPYGICKDCTRTILYLQASWTGSEWIGSICTPRFTLPYALMGLMLHQQGLYMAIFPYQDAVWAIFTFDYFGKENTPSTLFFPRI